eukprot:CAMPEP_0194087686 /NCGR_PEP_ID=MMETSP0149-20130528/26141_1 /TAXON_ID=122233 /ORGANISM="Chaetoceros debilis, Strain MM31A-1" /LENGTH=325 /DNA_ID=CAMNT_0038771137 /DNA_START=37 /DNA_END=1010 /DNA_ORIENTATION=-
MAASANAVSSQIQDSAVDNQNQPSNGSSISGTRNSNKGTSQSTVKRLENTSICVPIVYGSISFPLKKTEEYNTHRWTLFMRGANNEDLSQGIAKVVFQLHPSFAHPVRELTAPPFEVTEKGWGEFEANIRIVWRDPNEKALVLTHMLKLYPPLNTGKNGPAQGTGFTGGSSNNGVSGAGSNTTGDKKNGEPEPVIHQYYDEVVFTDPTQTFQRQLLSNDLNQQRLVESQEPSVQEYYKPFSDDADFKILLEAQKFLEQELVSVKDRILRADAHKFELENALAEVAAKSKAVSAAATAAAAALASSNVSSTSTMTSGSKRKSKSSG